jgi:hypothetical protein
VGKVQVRQFNLFEVDILPNVEFCPVRDREHAEVFAEVLAAVKDIPELGALVLGIPLAKIVAVREEALLGTGFFLVAAGTA